MGRVSGVEIPLWSNESYRGFMIPKVSSSNTIFSILSYYPTQEPSMILAFCIRSKGFVVTSRILCFLTILISWYSLLLLI